MKKTNQFKNLLKKTEKELAKELSESYRKLQKLQFLQGFGKLKDVHEISKTKRGIAQIWTILQEKYQEKE